MKQWDMPELIELRISETGHKWTGIYSDGGYIGDGQISGHLSWTPGNGGDSCNPPTENPTKPLS